MSYYTTIGKTVTCPYLLMKVTLTGKYRFIGESCQFSNATCEIVENSKLPPYEQSEDTKYYVCPQNGGCDLLKNFESGNSKVTAFSLRACNSDARALNVSIDGVSFSNSTCKDIITYF